MNTARILCCAALATMTPFGAYMSGQPSPTPAAPADEWTTYSGTFFGHRFSPLAEITSTNAARLRPAWVFQPPGSGPLEGTPIVAGGIMYVTSGPATVVAIDPKTARPLWQWSRPIPDGVLNLGFPRVNRGVAIADGTVYVGTLDGHLVALDAKSGIERWMVPVADNKTGHAITAAPLAVAGKIIVGISGGEAGIRGFLDAYDAKTGTRAWRFWTIPHPDEPGGKTWSGDSWMRGGGATWLTGSYDPALKLIYWGTGNPGPDWNGDARPGDNLYTCSLIAVDVESGQLRWHHQFTPHDVHDWDANQIPVLVDTEWRGQPRSLVITANRNGFFYALDRKSGDFLHASEYAKQTWAKGIDARGRPIVIPGTEPSFHGTLLYPSLQGSTNWSSPAFSPISRMLYVPVREMGSVYYKADVEYQPGTYYTGGSEKALREEAWGAVRALDIETGKRVWDFRLPSPPWAGVMATAGGLVFGGSDEGNFFALDAKTGEALWQFQTGSAVRSGPMSFRFDGRQYIVVASGRAYFAFTLDDR
jgi:alcohol dehydrogenase (cytochrome c)